MNKEQKEAHLEALARERVGYETRLVKVELDPEEKLSAEQLQSRIDQVDEQITLYGGKKKAAPAKKSRAKAKPKPEAEADAQKDDSAAK